MNRVYKYRRGLILIAFLAAGLALAWWAANRVSLPPIPEASFAAAVDPIVREDIRQARQKVVENLRSATAWGEYGLTLRAYEFQSEADIALATAAALDPAEARWPYLMGTHVAPTDPNLAVGWFQKARKAEPADAAVRDAIRSHLVESLLAADRLADAKAALGPGPFASPRSKLAAARIALLDGDDQGAAEYLLEVHNHPSAARQALALESQLYLRQGRPSFAAHTSQLAARTAEEPWADPFADDVPKHDHTVAGRLGWAAQLLSRKQPAEAEKVLAPLVGSSPDPRVNLLVGQAQLALGDRPQAIRTLGAGVNAHPNDLPIRYKLGLVLFDDGEQLMSFNQPDAARRRFTQAVGQFDKVLTVEPDFGKAILLKGTALSRFLDQPKEGVLLLQQYVAGHPDVGEGHLLLGQTYAAMNKPAEAKESLRRAALLANPDDSRAAQALARLEEPAAKLPR